MVNKGNVYAALGWPENSYFGWPIETCYVVADLPKGILVPRQQIHKETAKKGIEKIKSWMSAVGIKEEEGRFIGGIPASWEEGGHNIEEMERERLELVEQWEKKQPFVSRVVGGALEMMGLGGSSGGVKVRAPAKK